MEHCTKSGAPKILEKCTLPLTGVGVVDTIVTELGYMRVTAEGIMLEEVAPGLTAEDVQKETRAKSLSIFISWRVRSKARSSCAFGTRVVMGLSERTAWRKFRPSLQERM